MPQTETITLRMVAQDLASGQISKAIGGIDRLAQRGGIAGSVLQGVGVSFGMMFNPAMLAARGIGTLTDALGDAVTAASDQEEALNKAREVFDEASGSVEAFAETAATSLGLSEEAALSAAAWFGNLFVEIGETKQRSAEFSKELVALASDLASFNNIDPGEALQKLQGGLVGQTRALRELGIVFEDSQIIQRLKDQGLEVTQQNKVLARYQLILEQTEIAQGDFGRTSDRLANQQRVLAAEMDNALSDLGAALLPLATNFATFAADVVPVLVDTIDALAGAFENLLRFLQPDEMAGVSDELLGLVDGNEQLAARILETADASREANEQAQRYIDLFERYQTIDEFFIANADAINEVRDAAADLGDETEKAQAILDEYNARQQRAAVYADLWNQSTRTLGETIQDTTPKVGALTSLLTTGLEGVKVAVSGFDPFADIGKAFSPTEMLKSLRKSLGEANRELNQITKSGGIFDKQGRDIVAGIQIKMTRLFDKVKKLETVEGPAKGLAGLYIAQLGAEVLEQQEDLGDDMKSLGFAVQDDFLTGGEMDKTKFRTLFPVDAQLTAMGGAIGEAIGIAEKASLLAQARVAASELRATLPDASALTSTGNSMGATIGNAFKTTFESIMRTVRVTPPEGPPLPGRRGPRPLGEEASGSALGGPVYSGRTYLVGEKGPELLHMGGPGRITPNHRIGGAQFVYAPQVSTASEAEARAFMDSIGPHISRWMARQ